MTPIQPWPHENNTKSASIDLNLKYKRTNMPLDSFVSQPVGHLSIAFLPNAFLPKNMHNIYMFYWFHFSSL